MVQKILVDITLSTNLLGKLLADELPQKPKFDAVRVEQI